ncbi:unnamed protein product [Colias eurytheme]|nr:unnamed protein product [Colias eurytheme]
MHAINSTFWAQLLYSASVRFVHESRSWFRHANINYEDVETSARGQLADYDIAGSIDQVSRTVSGRARRGERPDRFALSLSAVPSAPPTRLDGGRATACNHYNCIMHAHSTCGILV